MQVLITLYMLHLDESSVAI